MDQIDEAMADLIVGNAPRVIDKFSSDIAKELSTAFDGIRIVALDLEGVDLGRNGKISIVQISVPSRCFLLDLLGKEKDNPLWFGFESCSKMRQRSKLSTTAAWIPTRYSIFCRSILRMYTIPPAGTMPVVTSTRA